MLRAIQRCCLNRNYLSGWKGTCPVNPGSSYPRSITNEAENSAMPIYPYRPRVRLEYYGTSFNRGRHLRRDGGVVRKIRGNTIRTHRRSSGETRIPPIKTDAREERFVRKWRAALGEALIVGDLKTVKQAYKNALPLISPPGTKKITQLLHQSYRESQQKDDDLPQLLEFALEIIDDLKSGELAPQPWAVIHLIGFFKESGKYQEGVDLWNFIAGKDHRYLTASTYGAMIELLTARGDSLASLEEVYKIGLKSDPGTFAEYHLASNAIVKDRSKRSVAGNLPLALLQGIYEARVKHGDCRNAYLALDTALRLALDNYPHRFFHLPILYRSAPEAYAAFILACRMGANLGPGLLKVVLSKMNGMFNQHHPSTTYYDHIREQQMLLKGMLDAIVAFVAVGGQLEAEHQRSLYAGLRHVIWNKEVAGNPTTHARAARAMGLMSRDISELFTALNVLPERYTFAHMIRATSGAGSSNFHAALQYVSSHNLEPNILDYRSILVATGEERDVQLLQQIWSVLIQKDHDSSRSRNLSWQAFARACNLAGCVSFGREEINRGSEVLPLDEETRENCSKILERAPYTSYPGGWMSLTEEQAFTIAGENTILRNMTATLVERVKSGNSLADGLPGTSLLDGSLRHRISDEHQKAVYNDLTADGSVPNNSQPDVNSMGIPFDTLRYENWKSINDLIYETTMKDPWIKPGPKIATLEEARRTIFKLRGLK